MKGREVRRANGRSRGQVSRRAERSGVNGVGGEGWLGGCFDRASP